MDFANGSRMSDPWAAAIYAAAVVRGCRQDHAAFDPALHRGPPRPAA
jgi:hypothetical protein